MSDSEPTYEEALGALKELAGSLSQNDGPVVGGTSARASGVEDARFRTLVEQIPAVTFSARLGEELTDIYVGPQVESLLGYSQAEWIGDPVLWYRRLHPDDRPVLNQAFSEGCRGGGPFRADCRFLARDGHVVWVRGEARLIADTEGKPALLQGVAFDITHVKEAEQVLHRSIAEKELLLREIHHRVKNNLQITSALLQMQARRTEVGAVRAQLQEAESRVRAMALVHDSVLPTEDVSSVQLERYCKHLGAHIQGIYNRPEVRFELIAEPVTVPLDRAVPCGLLIHELVANSYEHAFGEGRGGTLTVSVREKDGMCSLTVADDGPGAQGAERPGSLGSTLIRALARQLGATVELRDDSGHRTEISFKLT